MEDKSAKGRPASEPRTTDNPRAVEEKGLFGSTYQTSDQQPKGTDKTAKQIVTDKGK